MGGCFSSLSLTPTSQAFCLRCPALEWCGKIYFVVALQSSQGSFTPRLQLERSQSSNAAVTMGKSTIWSALREQWTTIPISNVDISDKSIVVTGANVGLGFEAAVRLAKLKPKRLLLTTRDEAKAKQAKQGAGIC